MSAPSSAHFMVCYNVLCTLYINMYWSMCRMLSMPDTFWQLDMGDHSIEEKKYAILRCYSVKCSQCITQKLRLYEKLKWRNGKLCFCKSEKHVLEKFQIIFKQFNFEQSFIFHFPKYSTNSPKRIRSHCSNVQSTTIISPTPKESFLFIWK